MTIHHFKRLFSVSGLVGISILLGAQSASATPLQTTPQEPVTAETSELTLDSAVSADSPNAEAEVAPVPPTAETTAASLQAETLTVQTTPPTPDSTPETSSPPVAQDVTPGRATRSGSSYIAVGGNIGIGDSTGLGQGSFVVTSKVGLTNNLSARPGVFIGDDTSILLPVTVDFPTATTIDEGRLSVAPFVGGGIAVSTGDDSEVSPIVTAGVDVPISSQFTAVASTNVSFFDDPEVGLMLGLGYNF